MKRHLFLLCALIFVMSISNSSHADLMGPTYPAPGGNSFSYSGNPGEIGGRTFNFSNLRLEKATNRSNESTNVLIDIKNIGEREGEEVVQMYIRDMFSSVTRPVKELKGFKKIKFKQATTIAIAELKYGKSSPYIPKRNSPPIS